MIKKFLCGMATSMLTIILLSGNNVFAGSRTLALTVNNQKNQTSSVLWCSNVYDIDYYAINGITSYGNLTMTITGTDTFGTYTTVNKSFSLGKDTTVASTGFSGNYAPISIVVDSKVTLHIKGNYAAYLLNNSNRTIGSAMIYTPTDEVNNLKADIRDSDKKITDEEIKEEMTRLKAEIDANVKRWDMQNKLQ